jgi:glycosyltransferase involved in cell wall biosynthesis
MNQLDQWLSARAFDLAYVSMLKHDAYVAVGVGKRRGFPVILRPEGAGATGDLAWQAWGRFGGRIGERCRAAAGVVSISPAIRGELERAGYDRARIHDIPNGVPVPDIPWRRCAEHAGRAVYVGRLAPEKGIDVLIEAWGMVRERIVDARLALVGEGAERSRLEALARACGLGESVEFLGARSDPSVVARGSGVFVLPSREEGMSIALLEAMALGMPIVATSIEGNRRVLRDGVDGLLAAVDDPVALAGALVAMMVDAGRGVAMGESARMRVIAEYSIEAMARRHIELFEATIRSHGRV